MGVGGRGEREPDEEIDDEGGEREPESGRRGGVITDAN